MKRIKESLGNPKGTNWLSPKMGRTICRNTSTAIILFKLVTKPNMAEFVVMDSDPSWQRWHQHALAGRQMVRTMVNENIYIELSVLKKS